jgi:hypothetical protein
MINCRQFMIHTAWGMIHPAMITPAMIADLAPR